MPSRSAPSTNPQSQSQGKTHARISKEILANKSMQTHASKGMSISHVAVSSSRVSPSFSFKAGSLSNDLFQAHWPALPKPVLLNQSISIETRPVMPSPLQNQPACSSPKTVSTSTSKQSLVSSTDPARLPHQIRRQNL